MSDAKLYESQRDLAVRLRKMKLEGFADEYEAQSEDPQLYAGKGFEFRLVRCLNAQEARSKSVHIESLRKRAGLRDHKRLGELNLLGAGLSQDLINSLSDTGWISKAVNIVIVGPTGVGKTALACAIGLSAISREIPVLYCRTEDLISMLAACDYASKERKLRRLGQIRVLILDDFCVNRLPPEAPDLLYSIMERRSESAPTIVVSQIKISSYRQMLGGTASAEGTVDRILKPAIRIEMRGESKRGMGASDLTEVAKTKAKSDAAKEESKA